MAKFAVFGSSYVTRLERYCHGDLKVPGTVRFFGKGGMRSDSIPRQLLRDLIEYNPDVVLIQLGGNDISATSSPNDIFQRLLTLQVDLHHAGIQEVYFTEIVRRGNFDKSPGLTATSFEKQRKKINRLLLTRPRYIKIRVNFPEDYDRDQVHFNDSGLRTQFHALRRPFFA
ncbi:uncharacterized protein LOC117319617 [Pecten maximus]|uniref:uncharacterized protein LOC117319617 n=1 Tax=Pecten maximus TaxID=6579 RepID=UPI001457EA50|nr:uncharacterized protein LOC117319617 [Pecten maximus]